MVVESWPMATSSTTLMRSVLTCKVDEVAVFAHLHNLQKHGQRCQFLTLLCQLNMKLDASHDTSQIGCFILPLCQFGRLFCLNGEFAQ